MAKKAKAKRKKKPGRTIADSKRRFKYDAGGQAPLSGFPLCPITVAITEEMKIDLKKMSELFIDPERLKPYGIAAVARVMMEIHLDSVSTAPHDELVRFFKQTKGTPGRSGFAEKYSRIQLLIPKHTVDRINERVMTLNDTEIGTATVIRWLLNVGISHTEHYQLYHHIPSADAELMREASLSIDDLVSRYRATADLSK